MQVPADPALQIWVHGGGDVRNIKLHVNNGSGLPD